MDKFMEIEVAAKLKLIWKAPVVGIFPSIDSYIRLITSYLLEYSDDWQTERCYMNASSIKLQRRFCLTQHDGFVTFF